ncbi:hypothetical protein LSTR_LSTR017625 [Laodelphax striatellus]|uniref:Uncharacterized protein n=1 Tax=Laodelphax striatellus TaxID=195883 RepID=A0A482WKK0_LAOST|nr:hypothetical protein LSTR_LSTR017625 [Laodelphax striatellus]
MEAAIIQHIQDGAHSDCRHTMNHTLFYEPLLGTCWTQEAIKKMRQRDTYKQLLQGFLENPSTIPAAAYSNQGLARATTLARTTAQVRAGPLAAFTTPSGAIPSVRPGPAAHCPQLSPAFTPYRISTPLAAARTAAPSWPLASSSSCFTGPFGTNIQPPSNSATSLEERRQMLGVHLAGSRLSPSVEELATVKDELVAYIGLTLPNSPDMIPEGSVGASILPAGLSTRLESGVVVGEDVLPTAPRKIPGFNTDVAWGGVLSPVAHHGKPT